MQSARSINEQIHFNDLASRYESLYSMNSPAALRKVDRLALEYGDYLSCAPEGPVVEFGSGTGFYTRHLAPKIPDRRYLACDLSEEMANISKSTFPPNCDLDIEWLQEDCLHTRFDNSSVSIVTGHGILHHLPLEKSIQEMARILMPGGRIAFYEPNLINPYVFLIKNVPCLRPEGDTPGETAINPLVLRNLLVKHGFNEIEITPYEFALNQLPEALILCFERISAFVARVPIIRYLGGSLKITAIRK